MFWFSRPEFSSQFRLIISESVSGAQEYILAAPNEHEAFDAAAELTKNICGDASRSVSAFLLDAHGVFLGDIDAGQANTDMAR